MSEFERVKITQTKGETLIFQGRIVAEATSEKPGKSRFEDMYLYETAKGTWIAVIDQIDGEMKSTFAGVIEAGGDDYARRMAVMEAFNWRSLARRMMRDTAGWVFERVVE